MWLQHRHLATLRHGRQGEPQMPNELPSVMQATVLINRRREHVDTAPLQGRCRLTGVKICGVHPPDGLGIVRQGASAPQVILRQCAKRV